MNQILLKRVKHRLNEVEKDLVHQKGCCGSVESINDNEHKRLGLVECLELLTERCAAPAPTGPTRKNLLGDVAVVDTSGHWIYPTSR